MPVRGWLGWLGWLGWRLVRFDGELTDNVTAHGVVAAALIFGQGDHLLARRTGDGQRLDAPVQILPQVGRLRHVGAAAVGIRPGGRLIHGDTGGDVERRKRDARDLTDTPQRLRRGEDGFVARPEVGAHGLLREIEQGRQLTHRHDAVIAHPLNEQVGERTQVFAHVPAWRRSVVRHGWVSPSRYPLLGETTMRFHPNSASVPASRPHPTVPPPPPQYTQSLLFVHARFTTTLVDIGASTFVLHNIACAFYKHALYCSQHDVRDAGRRRERHMKTETLDDVRVPVALEKLALRAWELDPLYRYLLEHGVQQAWLAGQLRIKRGPPLQLLR